MYKNLLFRALIRFGAGVVLVALLLFLPAGTLCYLQGLLLMAVLFLPMLVLGVVLFLKNPALLEKRLSSKEEQTEQDKVVKLSALMFLLGFSSAGLSFRFGWLLLPMGASYTAAAVFLTAYLLYAEVMRENAYLSRTVAVQQGQRVVDTGMYAVVRHPMYAATVLMFLSIPVILGSLLSFLLFLSYPLLIARRIRNEEEVLTAQLPGYADYKQRVKYRLVPFIW